MIFKFYRKIIKGSETFPSRSGFTLVETMIAIFVLSIAITLVTTATQSNLRTAYGSRDQMTAYFLAQEAIEYIRNIRDTDLVRNTEWPGSLPAVSATPTQYCVDPRASSIAQRVVGIGQSQCSSTGLLYYSSTIGFNHQNSGTPSRFWRVVTAEKRGDSEIFFTVSVKWTTGSTPQRELKIYKSLWAK